MGNRSSRSRRRSSVHRQAYAAEGPPPPPYKGSDRHPNDKEQYLGADQKHNPLSIATSYGPSPTQGATTSTVLQQSGSISGSEDALEVLRKYDIVVLMDDSFSMSYDNMKSWNEVDSNCIFNCGLPFMLHLGPFSFGDTR